MATSKLRRALSRFSLLLLSANALVVMSGDARAQAPSCQPPDQFSTCIDADNLWPHAGNGRWFSLAPAQLVTNSAATVGVAQSFVYRPIGFRVASPDPDGTTVYAVNNRFSTTFLTSIGVGEHLQLNLAAPFVLYQDGASTSDLIGAEETLPRSASGDFRFGIAIQLLRRPEAEPSYPPNSADGPALALRFDMVAPTGSKDAFASFGTTTYAPGVSFEQRFGRWSLGADVGARLRRYRRLGVAIVGPQIGVGLGAGVDILADGWLSAQLEGWALFTVHQQLEQVAEVGQFSPELVASTQPHIPAEWLLSVRTAGMLDGQLHASIGGGGSIPTGTNAAVTAPAARAVASIRYVFAD